MKAKGLMCLMAAVILLATAGVVCAADEEERQRLLERTPRLNYQLLNYSWLRCRQWQHFHGRFQHVHWLILGDVNTTGRSNTFFGYAAGQCEQHGQIPTHPLADLPGNLEHNPARITSFSGFGAGLQPNTGSNKLYIDNCYGGAPCTSPFIYGDFDNRL